MNRLPKHSGEDLSILLSGRVHALEKGLHSQQIRNGQVEQPKFKLTGRVVVKARDTTKSLQGCRDGWHPPSGKRIRASQAMASWSRVVTGPGVQATENTQTSGGAGGRTRNSEGTSVSPP